MSSRRAERGQTSVLIMGFFLVAVLLTVVVVDASAAFLRRQRLDAVADGAALAAADGVQGEQVYEGGLGERALDRLSLRYRRLASRTTLVELSRSPRRRPRPGRSPCCRRSTRAGRAGGRAASSRSPAPPWATC